MDGGEKEDDAGVGSMHAVVLEGWVHHRLYARVLGDPWSIGGGSSTTYLCISKRRAYLIERAVCGSKEEQ